VLLAIVVCGDTQIIDTAKTIAKIRQNLINILLPPLEFVWC
jgi:hypothetical protein